MEVNTEATDVSIYMFINKVLWHGSQQSEQVKVDEDEERAKVLNI